MSKNKNIVIVGGGLAGCEAAWQIANLGLKVHLYEMRPKVMTEAHKTDNLAELVCSNSFRSDDMNNNAVGLLHAEMRELNSLIMKSADKNKIPAGGALAVDREEFSKSVHESIISHPLIKIINQEYKYLHNESVKAIIKKCYQSLIMLPEIGLTRQFQEKFREIISQDDQTSTAQSYEDIREIVRVEMINQIIFK